MTKAKKQKSLPFGVFLGTFVLVGLSTLGIATIFVSKTQQPFVGELAQAAPQEESAVLAAYTEKEPNDNYTSPPVSFTYTFYNRGEYQLDVFVDTTTGNKSAYTLTITNPDTALMCPC